MGFIEKGTMVIIGLIFVLIIGQITVSINTDLKNTFANNSIFNLTGPLTLILLGFLGVGLTIGIILNVLKSNEPEPVQFQRQRRFDDFDE